MRRRGRRKILLSVCLASLFACSRDKAGASATSACDSACERLESQLGKPANAHRRSGCVLGCVEDLGRSRTAGCEDEHRAYLTCVGRSARSAQANEFSPAFALEHAAGLSACKVEHTLYEACTAPCREAGVVRTGERAVQHQSRTVLADVELIGTGCGPNEPSPARRSPAGAPCEHHSVCSATRCACPERAYGYLSRVCANGRCLDASAACSIALEVVGRAACDRGR
jgi:hypothetical protein